VDRISGVGGRGEGGGGVSEKTVLWREKWPNWGLNWREKKGVGVGEREKLAEKTRGEWAGEPNRPRPDLREREKGWEAVGV